MKSQKSQYKVTKQPLFWLAITGFIVSAIMMAYALS